MNTTKSPDNQKLAILPEEDPKKLKQSEEVLPGDIHKLIDKQIVPTRAPSGVERDISPGIPSKPL
ncbi:MAG: hypothetical protein K2X04_12185 [Burkholderiales bacterium]|nr:hypothetical protein [Burkholderiales bacterium]